MANFCWYELMTTDPEGAKAFYGQVMGWQTQAARPSPVDYTLWTMEGKGVGGLMPLPDGVPVPNWGGYVAVADIQAAAKKLLDLGGTVCVGPQEIAGVGHFAAVFDPQGAAFTLFQPACDGPGTLPQGTLGGIAWHELMAADWEQVFPFYAAMFGWTKAEAFDMGEMGVYQLFAADGQTIGGMMSKPPTVPRPAWLYYFTVANMDGATRRIAAAGGKVVNGPMEVPGGWIVQGIDPQGAFFALFSQCRAESEWAICRVFDAPREKVFDAWTRRELLQRWWGPKDFTCPVCEVEPKAGGAYRIVMRAPDGKEYPVKGVYREVTRPEKLVMTDDCSEHPADWLEQAGGPVEAVSTVTFDNLGGDDLAGRTRLTIRTLFASPKTLKAMLDMGMQQGWSESLDRLEHLLSQ